MKKLTKATSIILALLLLFSVTAFGEQANEDLSVLRKHEFGTNATELPITTDDVTLVVWQRFSSTIMEGADECIAYQELEARTGVKMEFVYPPVGQETDNFNLRIASNDLPHMFSEAPEYPGGLEKAVDDGIYLPITEYMEKGLTPNFKYLIDNYPEIARDTKMDSGEIIDWSQIDYINTSPWSGLWVRQDLLEDAGLEVPKTIDDWGNMLRVFKEKYGTVLGCRIRRTGSIEQNQAFVASYDTAYEWFAKDGKTATYGPIEEGYKEFLTTMNQWYNEGLLDPDFSTMTDEAYYAKMADGSYGAFASNYGEIGQAKVTGISINPDYKLLAVAMPTSRADQTVHIRQHDNIVRSGYDVLTTRCVDDGIDETAMKWKDYWYSQDGADLLSYGPEGKSYKWNEDGTLSWIYEETGVIDKGEELDFWTVYPKFKLHNGGYLRDSSAYEMQPEVWQCIEEWSKVDPGWVMPPVSETAEETQERSRIMTDINTYRDEMTPKFIMGQEPLENFDTFVEQVKGMGIDDAVAIKQVALDRYLAR